CSRARRGLCNNRTRFRYATLERAIVDLSSRFDLKSVLGMKEDLAKADLRLLRDQIVVKSDHLNVLERALGGNECERVVKMMVQIEEEIRGMKLRLMELEAVKAVQRSEQDHYADMEKLTAQLRQIEGQELFDLRARLSQELKTGDIDSGVR